MNLIAAFLAVLIMTLLFKSLNYAPECRDAVIIGLVVYFGIMNLEK